MKKKIVFLALLFIITIHLEVYATTIIGVVGKNKIFLTADTRLTMSKVNGDKMYNDNGKKVYKLINGVGVAFAGDSYSMKRLSTGKIIDVKSVNTIVNDINNTPNFKNYSVYETVELIAEKYVNILPDYYGEILVAGYFKDEAQLYGIRVVKGSAVWQGVKGRGSFWAIGSGSTVMLKTLKNNVDTEQELSNRDLGVQYLSKYTDKGLEALLRKSMENVIDTYKTEFPDDQRSTGGKVDMIIISK